MGGKFQSFFGIDDHTILWYISVLIHYNSYVHRIIFQSRTTTHRNRSETDVGRWGWDSGAIWWRVWRTHGSEGHSSEKLRHRGDRQKEWRGVESGRIEFGLKLLIQLFGSQKKETPLLPIFFLFFLSPSYYFLEKVVSSFCYERNFSREVYW